MKNAFMTFCALLLTAGCSGEATRIPISMDLTGVADTGDIERFLFVVNDPADSTAESLLFPQDCTGCKSATSPCPAADVCVELASCGFSVADEEFDARVDFSDFASGASIELAACAIDDAGAIVAAGATTFLNKSGETAEVVLDENDNACDILPDPCP